MLSLYRDIVYLEDLESAITSYFYIQEMESKGYEFGAEAKGYLEKYLRKHVVLGGLPKLFKDRYKYVVKNVVACNGLPIFKDMCKVFAGDSRDSLVYTEVGFIWAFGEVLWLFEDARFCLEQIRVVCHNKIEIDLLDTEYDNTYRIQLNYDPETCKMRFKFEVNQTHRSRALEALKVLRDNYDLDWTLE